MFESLLMPEAIQGYLYFAAVIMVPMAVLFKRAGFTPWGAAIIALPYSGLFLGLGFLALKRWPNEPARIKKSKPNKKAAK